MALYLPISSSVSSSGPAAITPPGITTQGTLMRPAAIRWAGTDLSQLERKTAPSKGVAEAWISIRLHRISREGRE